MAQDSYPIPNVPVWQNPERMSGGVGKLLEETESGFAKLRAEWCLYETIVTRILRPSAKPAVFLPTRASSDYQAFVAAPSTGRVTLMVHGRSWDGTGHQNPVTGRFDGFRDEHEMFDVVLRTE